MSDGRDARQVLDRLEKLLDAERLWNPFDEGLRFGRKLLRLSEDDKEILLQTANERWQVDASIGQLPSNMSRKSWHSALKDEVAFGTGVVASFQIVANLLPKAVLWALGRAPDVRDSDRIAEEFLQVVEARSRQDGGADMEAHIERAREATLGGVPSHYREKVLNRILERDERALRESGASAEEMKALEDTRDERRARGWRALIGKGGADRER